MEHLNFSTKSGSQSGSHRVVTLASTVGSPSAHRRGTMLRLLSVLVLVLTFGVGQMWGATENRKVTLIFTTNGGTNSGSLQDSTCYFSSSTAGFSGSVTDIISISTAKNNGSTAPTIYSDGLRFYKKKSDSNGGSITLTKGSSVENITRVDVSAVSGYTRTSKYKVDNGSETTITWSSNAFSINNLSASSFMVHLTENSNNTNQLRISQIVVYYTAEVASCSVDPTVGNIMNNVSNITATGATFTTSAGVSAGSNCSLSEVGFVYGTSSNPTITTGTKATITNYSSGNLSKSVTGLDDNTTYYVRAFATNGHGTAYSDEKSFTTPELAKYTVQFSTGEGNPTKDALTEASAGAGITLPTAVTPHCSGWTFAGWSESNVSSEATTAPTLLEASSTYHPASNCTLYAVYSRSETSDPEEQLIKSIGFESSEGFTAGQTYNNTSANNQGPTGEKWAFIMGTPSSNDAIHDSQSAQMRSYANNNNKGSVTMSYDLAKVTKVTFKAKHQSGSSLKLYYSTNSGTSWSDATSKDLTTTNTKYQYDISATGEYNTVRIKFENDYTNAAGRVYIDSVKFYGMVSSSVTYYLSAPECCTELAQINGSVSVTNINETGGTATWTWSGATTGISKNILKIYNTSDDLVKTIDNISASATSQSISGLTPCTEYYATLTTVAKNGYCDGAEQGKSDNFTTNGWTVNYTSDNNEEAWLSNVTKQTGAAQACLSENYVATFTANQGYALPDNIVVYIAGSESTAGDDYTWAISNGTGTLTVFTSELSEEIGVRIIGEALGCTADPTIGAASLSGTYSNSAVGVTVSSCSTGSADCVWTDYGFVWDTSANPEVTNDTHTTQIGIDGNDATWSGSLAGSFETGVEYHFRAYGKNNKDEAAYTYGADNTLTLRSVTFKDGATTLSTVYLNNGGKVAAPADPSKIGYDFAGWKLNSAAYDFNETVSSDLELQASWDEQTYTVTKTFTGCTSSLMPTSYDYTGTENNFSYTIAAEAKYALPAEISVTMGGEALTLNTDYTWNSGSGALAISAVITGNLVITVEAERLYSVTLMDLDADNTLTQATVGGNVELPTRKSCTGYTFAGWTASWVAEQSSWTSTAPASIIPAGNYAPTADLNLYPVYTKNEQEGEANTYNLVTDADDLGDGDEILIVSPAGTVNANQQSYNYNAQALSTTVAGNTRLGGTEVTISNNQISTTTATVFTLSGNSTDGYKIHSGSKYLYGTAKNGMSTTETAGDALVFPISIAASSPYNATIGNVTLGTDNCHLDFNPTVSQGNVNAYFALYTAVQKKVYIYKSDLTSVTYYTSVTGCCDALATIDGVVALTNENCGAGELKATWKSNSEGLAGISSQVLHIYKASDNSEVTAKKVTGLTASTEDQTQTISGLDLCETYYVKVENISAGKPWCASDFAGEKSANATTKGYSYSFTLTDDHVTKKSGTERAHSCEGDIMYTFEAVSGYVLPTSITVTNAGDENDNWMWDSSTGELLIYAEGVEGNVSVTITATVAPCAPMADPSVNVAKTYNGATLSWTAVDNAAKYKVYIYNNDDSDLESDENVTGTSYTVSAELTKETTYKYRVDAVSTDEASYCSSYKTGSFETPDYPNVTLYYSENGELSEGTSQQIFADFDLAEPESDPCAKKFVGWSAVEVEETNVAPTMKQPGEKYQIQTNANCTIYAVYATATPGAATAVLSENFSSISDGNSTETSGSSTAWDINTNFSNASKVYKAGGAIRVGKDGSITTKSLDLSNGAVTVSFKLKGWSSTENSITVQVDDQTTQDATCTGYMSTGDFESKSLTFTAGTKTSVVKFTTGSGTRVFVDDIVISVPGASTYSAYATTCVAAPTATPNVDNLNNVEVAGASGTITMTYDNVNTSNVTVGLFTNAACTDAFDGEWIEVDLDGSKNITYSIAANASYNDARSAYIKLTAPQTTGATDPAVVVIPVSQAKKAAVFNSLADLAAADVNANTPVTVSFSDVKIKEMYEYNDKVCGVVFNIQKENHDIRIYFDNQTTISGWGAGGKLSGTLTNCPWKKFSGEWQLTPEDGWAWNELTYTEPATVSTVAVSGTPSKTTYNVGEAFDPAGLTVHVVYSDETDADITSTDDDWAYVSWTKDPATFAAGHIGTGKSVSVTATYNTVPSSATEISGLTVNKVAVSGVTLNQNAATLKVGKTVTLTATVAPANATYKTVTWESDDEEVATVENGVVTAVAAGSATITVTATDDNTKTATCTITVTDGINFAAGDWTLVTDAAELTAGSYVIIAAAEYNQALKSYVSGNNCGAEDATKSGDMLEYDEDFGIFEIKAGNKVNTIALFDDANENYLYAASNSNNHLKAETTLTDNSSWSISVTSAGVASLTAQGTNSHNQMKYNNGSSIFSCYAGTQEDIALYKYFAPVPKVTYNKNTEDEVTGLPAVQKTVWETDAYKATVAAGPSRAGYSFTGWNSTIGGNGDAYAAGTKYSFAADITLYAQWEALPTYTVTYTANGGTGTAPAVEEYLEGATVTVKENEYFSKPGFVYAGWQVVYNDGVNNHEITPDEDSKFEMVAYNVTIKALWEEPSNQKWVRVESTDELATDGTNYIIVASQANAAMGALDGSYYKSVGIVKTGNYLNGPESMTKVTLAAGSEDGKYAMKNGTKYLYSTTAKSIGERAESFEWTITIAEGVATINSGTAGKLQFNTGNPRFTTYTSSQQAVAIYREKALTPINQDDMTEADVNTYDDVEIAQNKTWTVENDKEVGDVYMKEGAVIANSATVMANDLYFKAKAGKSNQIFDLSKITVEGSLYYDFQLCDGDVDADYWYSISVPFDVDLNSGVFQVGGTTPLVNRSDFEVWEYDPQKRADTQSNGWKRSSDNMMHAGKAYLIGFNPGQPNIIRLKAAAGWKTNLFSGTSMSVVSTGGSGAHDNWNGLANPTGRYIDVNVDAQAFNNNTHGWDSYALDAARFNFVVGTAFFVQSPSAITIGNTDHGNYRAPKREGANESKCAYAVRITRNEATSFDNQIIVRASEDATSEYEQGHDMLTMNDATSKKAALLWTKNYGGKRLAIEEAPFVGDKASYELGIYAPANGTYFISVAEAKDNADLYLTYEGSIIWNLSAGAYELELNKGATEGYGLMLVRKAPQVTTGVENVQGDKTQCTKVILNDHVYILRDAQLYDVTGKAVK